MSNSNYSGPTLLGRLLAVFGRLLAVLGAALGGVDAGTAQEADGLSIEVSECIELESPDERLACFESRVDRALENVGDANGATATGPASRNDPGAVSTADTSPAGSADPASTSADLASTSADSTSTSADTAPTSPDTAPARRDGAPRVSRDASREVESAAAARGSDRAASAARSSSDDFGFAPQDEGESGREELFATITSVREIEPNRYTITLDNGQVWRQVLRDRYRLRPGLQVRIYPTRWGESYRLSVGESRGFVQVQRVR